MTALSTFYVKRNDTREPVVAIAQDANGTPIDISGGTVKFIMANSGGTVVTNAAAVITNGTAGVMTYNWGTADTATAGTCTAEFQVTFSTGKVMTFPNTSEFQVVIRADLGS